MKKNTYFYIILILVVITIIALNFAKEFKTAEQVAAEAAPPPTSEPTVLVTNQDISVNLPVVCSAQYNDIQELKPLEEGNGNAQYTQISVVENELIGQGSLLAEINGEPVFAGIGKFSFYRDLYVGDKGPDVQLLNSILIELGYLSPKTIGINNVFDDETLSALGKMYSAFGYEAPSSETGFKQNSIIIIKSSGKIIEPPRDTGAVSDGPIAKIAQTHKSLFCNGLTGNLSSEVRNGQFLTIPEVGNDRFPITVVNKEETAVTTDNRSEVAEEESSSSEVVARTDSLEKFDTFEGSLRAEIILQESSGEEPVVPNSAVWSQNGQTVVTKIYNGTETVVPIKILFSGNGYNRVQPIESSLQVGDTIRIFTGVHE